MKGLLFTYLVTASGALMALFNPFYGLLAYVALAVVKPDAMWPWSVTSGRYSLIVALAMLVGWSYSRRSQIQFGRSGALVGILWAYLGWSAFLALFASDQEQAWLYVETMAKIVIPFFVGLTTIDSTVRIKQLAWTMAICEGYVALEFNRAYFGGYNQLAEAGFGTLDNNSAAIALVTSLGVTTYLGVSAKHLWVKCLAFGMTALIGHAVLFSYSRGGMLAMLVAAAVGFLLLPKRPLHYVGFAVVAVMALSMTSPEIKARFMSSFSGKQGEREASAQSRVDLWANCWSEMQLHPIMGCGPNHFPLVAPKYGWSKGKEAHSLWVQTGAEMGFPGLAILLSFFLVTCVRMWKLTWRRIELIDPWHRVVARMVITSLAAFVVAAQFVSLESLEMPYFIALLGAGVLKLNTKFALDDDGLYPEGIMSHSPGLPANAGYPGFRKTCSAYPERVASFELSR